MERVSESGSSYRSSLLPVRGDDRVPVATDEIASLSFKVDGNRPGPTLKSAWHQTTDLHAAPGWKAGVLLAALMARKHHRTMANEGIWEWVTRENIRSGTTRTAEPSASPTGTRPGVVASGTIWQTSPVQSRRRIATIWLSVVHVWSFGEFDTRRAMSISMPEPAKAAAETPLLTVKPPLRPWFRAFLPLASSLPTGYQFLALLAPHEAPAAGTGRPAMINNSWRWSTRRVI